MLTKADEGGGGVSQKLTIADIAGGEVYEPHILADVICEQPLRRDYGGKCNLQYEERGFIVTLL